MNSELQKLIAETNDLIQQAKEESKKAVPFAQAHETILGLLLSAQVRLGKIEKLLEAENA